VFELLTDPKKFIADTIREISGKVGDNDRVICAISGGVDSSTAAVLTREAIGHRLTCIFVDHGLLRDNEADEVMVAYKPFDMQIIRVNAADRFLDKLIGITDPEQKRKIIGREFITVFEEEANKLSVQTGNFNFLLQGTIYPDVTESGKDGAKTVKTHHNVGGLPDHMNLQLLEPLRSLYKDEARQVGEALGIAPELVWRQPFPGPGLAIRCLGEVTPLKLSLLRKADAIVREIIDGHNRYYFLLTGKPESLASVWQYFAVLPDIHSVGMQDGARTYGHAIAIRAVASTNATTANWAKLPYYILAQISQRITTEIPQINRVFYDITNKPPSTIEWE